MKTILCLAAMVLPAQAYAQTTPQYANGNQPIIVTATRIPTPVGQVPADVTVLTQRDFAAQGDTTLAQALSTVPGVNLVQSGGPGNAASLFIQGSNSEDVLVLVDGVPVNDPADANGAFNFGVYSLADIQRIEIVRGPMSGLYGSNAIGGVVNIITTRGDQQARAGITLAGGWPAQGQGSATLSGMAGKFDYAVSGALDEEAGFDTTPRRMSIYTGQREPYRAKLGAAQFGYQLSPETRLYLVLRAQSTDSAAPDIGGVPYDDPTNFFYNTNLFGKLGLSSALLDGRLTTALFIAGLKTRLHQIDLAAITNAIYTGGRTDAQWNNTLRLDDAGPLTFSSLLFGAEYSDETARGSYLITNGSYSSNFRAAQRNWAGHIGLQTTLGNRLTLTGALRDDAVSSFGNALTWRLGGVLAVPEADIDLKASVGTGFLAPSLFDLHYIDNYGDMGNPNLRPEYSIGWQAGPELLLPAFGRRDFADISATYFQNHIRNLIAAVGYPSVEQNINRASISGVETDYALNPADWLTLSLNYTYTRAVSGMNGPALLRRPQNEGSFTAVIRPLPALSIVPQVQYTGRFNDILYDNGGNYLGTGSSAPGTIVNLNVSYRLNSKFSLFATGKNILDSRFESVNGLQIPGASLLLGIRAAVE